MGKKNDYEDEEMTVELELDDGSIVNCAVITILTVSSRDYIVLLPLNEAGENEDAIARIRMTPMRSPSWITSTTMRNMKM